MNMFEYDVINGFSGMKRDIVLRLCELLWFKTPIIRAVSFCIIFLALIFFSLLKLKITGMCEEHYIWKSHWYFEKGRKRGYI